MKVKRKKLYDIELDTKDEAQQLILKGIKHVGLDEYQCRLLVNSQGFMCDRSFKFAHVGQFLTELRQMNIALSGQIRLSQEYEDNFIELKADGLGHIYVTGQIVQFADVDQTLEFGFITDQTCLTKLINDIERLVCSFTE